MDEFADVRCTVRRSLVMNGLVGRLIGKLMSGMVARRMLLVVGTGAPTIASLVRFLECTQGAHHNEVSVGI